MHPLLLVAGLACTAWTSLELLRLAHGGGRLRARDLRTGRRLTLRPERRQETRGRRSGDRRPATRSAA